MSNGPSKELTKEQIAEASKRLESILRRRVKSLQKKVHGGHAVDQGTRTRLIQADEDLHVFTLLVELCESLVSENEKLNELISSLGEVNAIFATDGEKKKLPN